MRIKSITIQNFKGIRRKAVALLLSNLSEIKFEPLWFKNADLLVNGYVSDAGLWVTQTLSDRRQDALSRELALELAVYLNTQPKRVNKSKSKLVPVLECWITACHFLGLRR